MTGEPFLSFECADGSVLLRADRIDAANPAPARDRVLAYLVVSVGSFPEEALDYGFNCSSHLFFLLSATSETKNRQGACAGPGLRALPQKVISRDAVVLP
jgi:hypothetical protein